MDGHPIRTIERSDPGFPGALLSLDGMPDSLFVRGDLSALSRTPLLAVVGTRGMTRYGAQVVEHLVGPVAARGVTIVSGLALGIDAAAHRTCLNAGGVTVAVLGSGIDDEHIGPRTNFRLAHDILTGGGALVSEFAPGMKAERWTFPARNRIVSALAAAVLVIEADLKSGALITARCAADQGRDVLAVPGSILWPRSEGPNMLIRNGARPVATPDDILEALDVPAVAGTSSIASVSTQNPFQSSIVAILQDGPSTTDALTATLDAPVARIMGELTKMELTGIIVRGDDGSYRIP